MLYVSARSAAELLQAVAGWHPQVPELVRSVKDQELPQRGPLRPVVELWHRLRRHTRSASLSRNDRSTEKG